MLVQLIGNSESSFLLLSHEHVAGERARSGVPLYRAPVQGIDCTISASIQRRLTADSCALVFHF